MKAIMISIKPQWVAKILNGEKTIEVRKKFPKDYVGWVYIYVTRNKPYLYHERTNIGSYDFYELTSDGVQDLPNYKHAYTVGHDLNGKVVARFWCDKVEEIEHRLIERHYTETLGDKELLIKSCLSHEEIHNYLRTNIGYAIHITEVKPFDKPKELWEFKTPKNAERYKRDLEQARKEDLKIMRHIEEPIDMEYYGVPNCVELTELSEGYYGLTRAPQSYCFIEIGE